MIFTEVLEPKLIPKAIRDHFTDFKETEKSSENYNHISFRATSKIDNKPYTIRALNIHGSLYKTNKSQSIKLYLQELFYLSARFGRNQGDIESTDEILLFRNFEVGDDGAMAFVMRDLLPVSELISRKDRGQPICIEDLAKQLLSDILFINSRFGISNIDMNLENVCCFQVQDDFMEPKHSMVTNFFVAHWERGKVNKVLVDSGIDTSAISTLDISGTQSYKTDFRDSKSEVPENIKRSHGNFPTELIKDPFYQLQVSAWIYSIGLLMLEVAGMPRSIWRDLSKLENHRNYEIILEFMIQSLSHEYGQPSSLCSLVSAMLSREPYQRVIETKRRLQPLQDLSSMNLKGALKVVSELMHPLFSCTELHRLIKQLENDPPKSEKFIGRAFSEISLEDIEERKSELKSSEMNKSISGIYLQGSETHRQSIQELKQIEKEPHNEDKYCSSNFLRKTQVQLLIILERLYREKTPILLDMEPEVCIQDCLKFISKFIMASQSLGKKLHPEVKSLLEMNNPQDLNVLKLASKSVGDLDTSFIGKCTKWKNLKVIELSNNQISDRGLKEITENKTWTNLQLLDIRGNFITEEGATKIGLNQSWSSLRLLYLFQNRIGDEGAKNIASNTVWTRLEYLDLANNFISDRGAVAIGANVTWKMLQTLQLYENEIGSVGACALASNTTWKNLAELDLEKNKIGHEGAIAIAKNPTWVSLRKCYLSGNLFEEKDIAFILENNTWKKIRELILKYESIKLGDLCQTCKKALKNSFPQFYNYQKNLYYCMECVERAESSIFGLKFGLKKSIDSNALLLIDVTNKPMLNKILSKRIGDQVNPQDPHAGENISFHDAYCDLCFSIIGKSTRWKCLNCKNFDMCDKCYLLSKKREPQNVVLLKIRGHDVDTHILQRYLFVEKLEEL